MKKDVMIEVLTRKVTYYKGMCEDIQKVMDTLNSSSPEWRYLWHQYGYAEGKLSAYEGVLRTRKGLKYGLTENEPEYVVTEKGCKVI